MPFATSNPATRSDGLCPTGRVDSRPGTTLLGVDFSLGYPAGTASTLGLQRRAVAGDVGRAQQSGRRRRRQHEQPFRGGGGTQCTDRSCARPVLGMPANRRSASLTSTKVAPDPLDEWRIVEHELRRVGRRPFSGWQLLGAGSVGSQSLLGIPRLARLEASLVAAGRSVDVWPFGRWDGVAPPPDVVIAEVWPSLHRLPELRGRVRDEVQVVETARRLAEGVDFRLDPSLSDDARESCDSRKAGCSARERIRCGMASVTLTDLSVTLERRPILDRISLDIAHGTVRGRRGSLRAPASRRCCGRSPGWSHHRAGRSASTTST